MKEAHLDMAITPIDPGEFDPEYYFVDRLIQAVLKVDSLRLETFVHIASLPLHPSTFKAVRTQATHLRRVVFRTSIQSNLRPLFNQPARWASASTLKELAIRTCSGVHHGAVAIHVANGVFGHLERLNVIRCGYNDDDLFVAAGQSPAWNIGVLKRLDIDHADHREVMALSIIHVQEVFATRVYTSALINALNAGGWPELQVLHTQPQGDGLDPQFVGLKQVCDAREISLLTDAEPYGDCNCHHE